MGGGVPYWRLSAFYFFYFAFLGAWVPYWSLYLSDVLELSAEAIGWVLALVALSRILGPYCWGWLADATGRRTGVIRLGATLALLAFSFLFVSPSFVQLLLVIGFYSFFWNAILAQFEVVTLSHLVGRSAEYSKIRLWGSIGFVASVFGLGLMFEWVSVAWLPHALFLLLVGILIASLAVREKQGSSAHKASSPSLSSFWQQLKRPEIVVFFVICFLMQASHGPYYAFFSIYMENLGYHSYQVGALWALGVAAEVIIFMVMHKAFERFSMASLLVVTLALTAVRWFALAHFAENFVILIGSQLLHAASFGSFHAISIELIRRYFPHSSAGQAQAFYSATSYGIGGAVGAAMSGYLWEHSAMYAFSFAGFAVLIALLVLFVQLRIRDLPAMPAESKLAD